MRSGNSKVDFAEVKKIPIGSVLRQYDIKFRRQGETLIASRCPLPTHSSEEVDTFKVNIQENYWTCYSQSCRAAYGKNGGDVIDLVCALDNTDRTKPLPAAQKLAELFGMNQSAPREAERDGHLIEKHSQYRGSGEIRNKPLVERLPGFKPFVLNPEHPMIQRRGISTGTARDWDVGYYEDRRQGTATFHQRILFPLLEDGALVGYLGRATIEGQEPKWKIGVRHKTMLFGIERCDPAEPLIVYESCWEVLLAWQAGKQACALLGTAMRPEQERKLEPYRTIWLIMDDDDAGKVATAEICSRLRRTHKVVTGFLKD